VIVQLRGFRVKNELVEGSRKKGEGKVFNYAFELLSFSGMGVQFVRSNCSDLSVIITSWFSANLKEKEYKISRTSPFFSFATSPDVFLVSHVISTDTRQQRMSAVSMIY